MTTLTSPSGTLASIALADLQARFADYGTNPSHEQWQAIGSLLECLEESVDSFHGLKRSLYLSPIPCGVGKSQTIAAFARALAAAPDLDDVGMLILVSRINEARDTAAALEGCRDKLCVMTSDAKVNALGDHQKAQAAQICVATQESLRIALKTLGAFEDCSTFAYRFTPRAVRVWDESFNFNRPVVMDNDGFLTPVANALQAMGKHNAKSAIKIWSGELDAMPADVKGIKKTWNTTAPDLRALGVDFDELARRMDDCEDGVHMCEALALISGNKVGITRGTYSRPTIITHYPEIPRSLMPLIVTDASALVNQAYAQMAERGTPIVLLKEAGKTYANMTVRIVGEAASRSQYRKAAERSKLLDGVVRYIRESDDHVLVFGYKGSDFAQRGNTHRTLKAQLQHRLGAAQPVVDDDGLAKLMATPGAVDDLMAQGRVVFYLTHGRGTATNFYRCIKRVCLMGLDFPAGAVAHATSGAAQDLDLINDHPTQRQLDDVNHGILLDRTLQPGLRGAARVSNAGDCMPMELVVFQSPQSGLAYSDYQDTLFPSCRVIRDTTIFPPKAETETHLQKLLRIAAERLKAGETVLSFASLREALGQMTPANFADLIRSDEWLAFLGSHKLAEVTLPVPGRTRGRPPKGYSLA